MLFRSYEGVFIRRRRTERLRASGEGGQASGEREAVTGLFGLVPHWSADTRITRYTYNARSETVSTKPSFRDAWRRAQHCIVTAESLFEPDWRSGKAVPACVARLDGAPMGIAGLWSSWRTPTGETVYSYTMLTVHANHHTLMGQFHKPQDEKRMVVILPADRYDEWLDAPPSRSMDFMRAFPAEELQVIGGAATAT